MHQARENHPTGMPVAPNTFGGLQQVLGLRKIRVGVGVVDELIQILQCLPHAHFHAIEAEVFLLFRQYEGMGLALMIELIEFPHGITGVCFVVAKFLLLLIGIGSHGRDLSIRGSGLRVAFFQEVFPFIQALQRGGRAGV